MIELAKKIQRSVRKWRKNGYEGTSDVTSRLLEYWFQEEHYFPDNRKFEFWNCQREAIEALIYTYEVSGYTSLYKISQGYDTSIEFDPTLDRWPRYCFRMATGSGKTFVMALSMLWQYYNSIFDTDNDLDYSQNFLLIAPNLIVLERLRDFEDNKIFHEWPFFRPPEWESDFDLQTVIQSEDVPSHSRGVLHITNVQQFYERGNDEEENPIQEQLGPRPVTGEEFKSQSDLYDILGRYEDLAVLNDEAHHAHPDTEWWEAISTLHNQLENAHDSRLTMQLDFSATPMYTGTKERIIFPHVIYDYPLGRAIDDKIVKRPHIGTIEDKPESMGEDFVRENQIQIDEGVELLKKKKEELSDNDKKPVLFIMCDHNENADKVGEYLESDRGFEGRVLVIHTYKRKTKSGFTKGDVRREELPELREAAKNIDHNEYEIIVSVMMLNEGWDVKNVSVIVPLRAFESNILVEQTLGRGLRRMFPENDQLEEKLIVVEHPRFKEMWEAEIKEKELDIEVGKVQDVPEPNKIEVDEEKMDHDFEIPIVQGGITKEVPDLSELNISNLDQEAFVFDDVDEYDPQYVEKDLKTKETTERRDIQFSYADRHQEYLSYVTRGILRKAGSSSQFSDLLPSVKTYIENFLFDQQIEIDGPEVLKKLNRPHIRNKIVDEFVKELNNLSTVESKYRIKSDYRLSNTDPIHTSRDVIEADKTVFNALPYDSSLEKRFMVFLDNEDTVHSYTKILPQFPMRIPYYDEDGILRHYLSDFVVKMGEERFFLIETKGGGFGEMKSVKLKDRAAKKWCERVSDISGTHWTYAKIMQEDFERNKGLGLHELLNTS